MNTAPARHTPNRMPVFHQLRSICTRFPHVEEIDGGSQISRAEPEPLYKVEGRIFAMQHRVDDRIALWCKAAPGIQEALVGSDSGRFFVPPYIGHRGWVGIWLDHAPDWAEIDTLIEDSYRRTAPARLIPLLDALPDAHRAVCQVVSSACGRDQIEHAG